MSKVSDYFDERTRRKALRRLIRGARGHLKPPPKLTVSQWADEHRMLSAGSSAEPGRWITARAEYMRGAMDAIADDAVTEVVMMASAQVGKSEFLLNILGYHIDQDPAPILLIQPTLEMAEAFSKDRLSPMLKDSPRLAGKVKDVKSRDSGNTILHKVFPGGQVTLAGANSPSSLASRPKRIIVFDEVDRYPPSAGTEGDPVDLGKKRSTTFYNAKHVLVSTPTIKGISRIEKAFLESDQRYYHIACPHCGHEQRLVWANVKWPEGKPHLAAYACADCGALIDDAQKQAAVRNGRWIATAAFNGVAGFHINELYSPWRTFAQTANDFLKAKRAGRESLKTWTNTALGETWEEQEGESIDAATLLARCKPYTPLTVPMDCLFLTCGVDVQRDRLALVVRGWGEGEKSSLVYHTEIYGDVLQKKVWSELDDVRNMDFEHASGNTLRILVTTVDSGDGVTVNAVYDYCHARREQNVIAIKGSSRRGEPIIGKASAVEFDRKGVKIKNAKVFMVGPDTAKALIYARLRCQPGDDGEMSWYVGVGLEYFQQLTAEKVVTKYLRGHPYKEWVRTRPRNEALDCEVYALAAAHYAGLKRINWEKARQRLGISPSPDELQHDAALHTAENDGTLAESDGVQPEPEPVEPPKPVVDRDLLARRKAMAARGRGRGWSNGWQ